MSDKKVSKEEFNQKVSEFFNCKKENIIDIYGMTEQLGTIYPDCSEGNKHVSVFSTKLALTLFNIPSLFAVERTLTLEIGKIIHLSDE